MTESGILRAELARMAGRLDEAEARVRERDATIAERDAVIASMAAEISQLRAMLAKAGISDAYHNGPHSPSSSGSMSAQERAKKEAERRAEKGMGKPGRKKGHVGVTSKIKAERTVHYKPDRCNKCGSTHLHETSVKSKQTVEVVEIVLERINHVAHDYRCMECGTDVAAPRTPTVKGTSLGPSLTAAVVCLWKHGNSLGAIQGILGDMFKVRVCRATVQNTVAAVADELAEEDAKIRQRARDQCEPGGLDETGYGHTYRNEPISDSAVQNEQIVPAKQAENGPDEAGAAAGRAVAAEPWWPTAAGNKDGALPARTAPPDPVGGCRERKQNYGWGLVTNSCTVIRVEPSRGAAILHEYFGDRIGGANTSDGYAVYDVIEIRQRCFPHLLREADQLSWSKKPVDVALNEKMKGLFGWAKDLASPGGAFADPHAHENRDMLTAAAKGLAAAYKEAGHDKFAGKLERAADNLFTFLVYPGLEPTNNACERAMRALIMQRDTRRKCATAGGRARVGILMTCLETWKKQGLSAIGKLGEILGAAPAPEYAQIRATGPRARLGRT